MGVRKWLADHPSKKTSQLVAELNPNVQTGLTEEEASLRLAERGKNLLTGRKTGRWRTALAPVKEPMVWLLLIATVVYYSLGDALDATITGIAVIPIALIDLVIETRTDNALRKLEAMREHLVRVVRGGKVLTVNPDTLVPGDRILVSEGDIVMADAVVLEATELQVDESSLTGESLPVLKRAEDEVSEESFGGSGTLLAGTKVLSGKGSGMVFRTGRDTLYGEIGSRLATTQSPRTRLQKEVARVVWIFGGIAVALSVALVPIALLRGDSLSEAFLGAISLAIAAIPEELPVAFTIFLAFGMLELSRNRALVRRLPAVEALGSINVVCTDKTGTLTSGVMKLTEVATDGRHELEEFKRGLTASDFLLRSLMACQPDTLDAMEKAVYESVEGTTARSELEGWRLVAEYPFDPARRIVTNVWEKGGRYIASSKGSVEAILERSRTGADERVRVEALNREMASEGTRVLALAAKASDKPGGREWAESGLEYEGLVGFSDPLRPGAKEAVAEAQAAGVRVIMLTGDQEATAHAIAHRAGIDHDEVVAGPELERMDDTDYLATLKSCNVFCRVTPEHKLRIVEGLQRQGFNVAVTGDGVNDSPALKKADIGVAMGKRGTEVAKEAASLVLLDDNFSTIVGAIRNGRKIYDNLESVFGYLVAFHVPILFAALVVPIVGLPLLLLPIQIVILELVLHPVISLVFEGQPAEPGTMSRPPRPKERPMVERGSLIRLVGIGFFIFAASYLGYSFGYSWGYDEAHARSLGFTVMVMAQVAIIPAELGRRSLSVKELLQNRRLFWITGLALLAYVALIYLPGTAEATKMSPLSGTDWALILGSAVLAYVIAEATKRLARNGRKKTR